ncbi:superoxide dismutase [Floridanema evergladense]|uniref:Superoxide dismutase n=1 Tax=Floridaenema evergladense BLCC-F167 TaxID=3153639 RepID=A0ABV4WQT3_9CYAN
MAIELAPLPFDYSALDPKMSKSTLEFHHDKHHAAYVTNLNKLIEGTELADKSLEEIVVTSFKEGKTPIFNNAGQVWNHNFFWQSLKPGGGGTPTGALADKINADFGSFDKFKEEFKTAATTQFGSGWAWLVVDNGTLKVTKTPNAENPVVHGQTPLLTLDVWEHAYYLDYQNKRPDFITTYLESLVNWDFAAENFSKA